MNEIKVQLHPQPINIFLAKMEHQLRPTHYLNDGMYSQLPADVVAGGEG